MNRFLSVTLAVSFTVLAMAVTVFLIRPRAQFFRATAGELRHALDEVIEEVTKDEEAQP